MPGYKGPKAPPQVRYMRQKYPAELKGKKKVVMGSRRGKFY